VIDCNAVGGSGLTGTILQRWGRQRTISRLTVPPPPLGRTIEHREVARCHKLDESSDRGPMGALYQAFAAKPGLAAGVRSGA